LRSGTSLGAGLDRENFMIRAALLLCAGIIAAASFACAPAPPPPPPVSVLSAHHLANCDVNNPSSFPSAVTMLAPGFDPSQLQPPVPTSPPPALTTQMKTDLVAAFTAAPLLFRAALCRLDGIYVDPSATNSWGFRVPASYPNALNRYIGLAANLWGSTQNSPVTVYSAYETSVLSQITQWPAPSGTVPFPPEFNSVMSGTMDVDSSALTLVAVLAHEFGHVLWYDKVKGANYPYYPNNFCQGSGTNFFDGSWTAPVSMPDAWVKFAMPSHDTPAPGSGSVANLQAAIQTGQWATAGSILNQIYTIVWPSLLGAVSPEEDFAETVKLFVLTLPGTNQRHPITSMPLDIYTVPQLENPSYTPDVFAGLSRRVLAKKILCIKNNSG
jgi:hypothetical protein